MSDNEDDGVTDLAKGCKDTLESIIRAQRRIKGVIVSVTPGNMRIACEYGEFPFIESAVKVNKRFPDRQPKQNDRCEFKISNTRPPKAVSIRVAVPKRDLAVGGAGGGDEGDSYASSFLSNSSPQSGDILSGIDELRLGFTRAVTVTPAIPIARKGEDPAS